MSRIDELLAKRERLRQWAAEHADDEPQATPTAPLLTPTTNATGDTYGGSLVDYLGDDDPGDDADAWIIEGIVAAGVPQMTAGHPKSYKTFLMEHQAISIAAGLPLWLGRFKTRRGNVLILPREDSVRETRRRLWRLARGLGLDPRSLDGRLLVDSLSPFYWDDDSQVGKLFRTIERFRPSLIIIDSLSRTHMGDENSVKEMSVVCNRWSDICQQTGVAISMIHHFTKSGTGTLLQSLRGTGNIGATLRHLVGVEKPDVFTDPFELSFDGNLQGQASRFAVRVRDFVRDGHKAIAVELARGAGTAEDGLSGPIVGELADKLLNAGGTLTLTDLRKGRGTKVVDPAIKLMEREGLIRVARQGQKHCGYQLTDAGVNFATGRVAGTTVP